MNEAAARYVQCVSAAADAKATDPIGAEEIATAAHASCWTHWEAYRQATRATFASDAATDQENQYAQDKATAHLRGFEFDTRRSTVDRIVNRNLRGATAKP